MQAKSCFAATKLYCSNCGQANDDSSTFCQKCGASLKATNAQAGGSPGSNSSSPQPNLSSQTDSKTSFDISSTFSNAIALVRAPVAFMNASNRDGDLSLQTLMINYVAVLAAIPFIATLLGDLWWHYYAGVYSFPSLVASAIFDYIGSFIGVFVVGIVIWKLAPYFSTTTTQVRATRLAAYIFTPAFLIGILDIIPPIAFLTVLGVLYGLYILYLGVPILMNTPKDKVLTYVIGVIVATIVVYIIIALIIAAIAIAALI
jgi:hypothetical protein